MYLSSKLKRFTRVKFPPALLVAFVLVGVFSFVYLQKRLEQSKSIESKLETILVECSNNSQDILDYSCLRERLGPLVEKSTVNEILDYSEELFAKQDTQRAFGTLTCHGPGHIVGEIAIEKGITFGEIMRECSRKCDYGCLHGAFIQKFKLDENFLKNLTSVCKQFEDPDVPKDLTSCYHIVGHGLADIFRSDVEGALSQCDRFAKVGGHIECGLGVSMEYLLGSPEGFAMIDLSRESILDYCSRLPGVHSESCYGYAGFYAYSILDEDAAINICNEVPKESKEECIYSFGSIVYFTLRSEPEKILKACNRFEGKLRNECIKGTLEINVGEKPFLPNAFFLCRSVDESFRKECFSTLGIKLEWSWGRQYREEVCSGLEREEMEYCMADPL